MVRTVHHYLMFLTEFGEGDRVDRNLSGLGFNSGALIPYPSSVMRATLTVLISPIASEQAGRSCTS